MQSKIQVWSFSSCFNAKTFLPHLLIFRFWFNFSVDNVHVDQRIIFNIVNLSKTRNLFTLGLTPIVRSSSRPKWSSILISLKVSHFTFPGKGFQRRMCIITSRQSIGLKKRKKKKWLIHLHLRYLIDLINLCSATTMSCHLPLPLIGMRKSTSLLSPTHTHTPGTHTLTPGIHTHTPGESEIFLNLSLFLSLPHRVQAFIQQLVDTRPDMVTREVVGKTIVSDSTKVSEEWQTDVLSFSKGEIWISWPSLSRSWLRRRLTLKPGRWERQNWKLSQSFSWTQVKKRVVMVMARQHPGESPASYVVQGLIDFLVSKHKIAQELREKLIFKVGRRRGGECNFPIPGHSYDEPWWSVSWKLQGIIAWWVDKMYNSKKLFW